MHKKLQKLVDATIWIDPILVQINNIVQVVIVVVAMIIIKPLYHIIWINICILGASHVMKSNY